MSDTRLDLPSAAWVEFRDPKTMMTGEKKKIFSSVTDRSKEVQASFEMLDALLAALIANWSLPLPLPSAAPGVLDRVPEWSDYIAMTEWAQPVLAELNNTAPTPDQALEPDPQSPTQPSDV